MSGSQPYNHSSLVKNCSFVFTLLHSLDFCPLFSLLFFPASLSHPIIFNFSRGLSQPSELYYVFSSVHMLSITIFNISLTSIDVSFMSTVFMFSSKLALLNSRITARAVVLVSHVCLKNISNLPCPKLNSNLILLQCSCHHQPLYSTPSVP